MKRRALLTALLSTPLAAVAAVLAPAPNGDRGVRVTLDKTDPGYDPWAVGFVEVYFNDKKLDGCTLADEELGLVVVMRRSFDRLRGWEHVEMRGKVRVRYLPGHPKNPRHE